MKLNIHDSDLDDDNYGYSAQWKCSRQSNGQTYWSLEKTELCPRDCAADGQCNMYPGEREACTAADYQNKCIADGKLMYCEDRLNPPKTVVTDCQVLGSLFNIEMTCLDIKNGSKNDAKCGPVKNTTPCTTVGTKKDVCQTYSPNDSVSVAYRYRAVCTEFSDGSLRYLIDADTLSGCSSGKCNDFQSDCEY